MRFERPMFRDSAVLYEWRNDPVTMKMSFNESPISWDEHSHWFETTLWNGTYIYMVIENDMPIGVIRFDQTEKPHICEMSITLAPHMRGKGIGTQAIREGTKWFLENDGKRFSIIKARVKVDNVPSMRAFLNAGFVYTSCLGNANVYTFSRDDGLVSGPERNSLARRKR